ncbi:SCO family protein [Shewanella sp. 202IG2-18]|uniref:SCO family protein n=1 Tax=Parashewanella hymeniacidonis TaxID=2807618 RepID=UPI00195F34D4|nr:SCO family protein [Parashewanella hymeniacidonis]
MKKSLLIAFAFVIFASFGGYASYYYQHRPLHLLTTAEYPNKTPVIPFKLTDQYGHKFDNSNLKGKWTLFFVGYTSCPDICPTAMTKLAAAYPKLIKDNPFQVVFISVDPNRDTPDKLKQYTSFFNKKFIAVTGEQKQLLPLTRNLGMAYSLIGEGKNYQITHSATMTLVSPQGEKIAIVKPQIAPGKVPQIKNKEMVADVEQLMSRYS